MWLVDNFSRWSAIVARAWWTTLVAWAKLNYLMVRARRSSILARVRRSALMGRVRWSALMTRASWRALMARARQKALMAGTSAVSVLCLRVNRSISQQRSSFNVAYRWTLKTLTIVHESLSIHANTQTS